MENKFVPLYLATGEYVYRFNYCIENIVHHLVQEDIINWEDYLKTIDTTYKKLYDILNDNNIMYAELFDNIRLFRNRLIHSITASGYIPDEQIKSMLKNPTLNQTQVGVSAPCFVNMSEKNKKMSFIYTDKIIKHTKHICELEAILEKVIDKSKTYNKSYPNSGYNFEF